MWPTFQIGHRWVCHLLTVAVDDLARFATKSFNAIEVLIFLFFATNFDAHGGTLVWCSEEHKLVKELADLLVHVSGEVFHFHLFGRNYFEVHQRELRFFIIFQGELGLWVLLIGLFPGLELNYVVTKFFTFDQLDCCSFLFLRGVFLQLVGLLSSSLSLLTVLGFFLRWIIWLF